MRARQAALLGVPGPRSCVAFRRGLTGMVPAPRPRKRLPHKRTLMLALVRAGEVLLEKRPSSGIWGGMWCLPEAARKTDIEAYCLERSART